MIQNNFYKYAVSVMYKVIEISRSTCYYAADPKTNDITLENDKIELVYNEKFIILKYLQYRHKKKSP